MVILTDKEIKAAREWLADCQFLDIYSESQIFEMDDIQIQNAIKQHFDGGIEGFRSACGCDSVSEECYEDENREIGGIWGFRNPETGETWDNYE